MTTPARSLDTNDIARRRCHLAAIASIPQREQHPLSVDIGFATKQNRAVFHHEVGSKEPKARPRISFQNQPKNPSIPGSNQLLATTWEPFKFGGKGEHELCDLFYRDHALAPTKSL